MQVTVFQGNFLDEKVFQLYCYFLIIYFVVYYWGGGPKNNRNYFIPLQILV